MEENKTNLSEEELKSVVNEEFKNFEDVFGADWRDKVSTKDAWKIIFANTKKRIFSKENNKKKRNFLIKLAIVIIAAIVGYEAFMKKTEGSNIGDANIDMGDLGSDIPDEVSTDIPDVGDVATDIPVDNVVNFK